MIPTGGCALANLIAGEDPIGTATPFDQLFLLQVPPPWARIALDSPAVPAGVRQALIPALQAKRQAYALLIDGDEPLDDGVMRVLFYRRPYGPTGAYLPAEYLVPRHATADLIRNLSALALETEANGRTATGEAAAAKTAGARRVATAERDLLVCTHGERDGCCGRFGEAAYRHLHSATHPGGVRDGNVRVWRVSHFGGHRFAPTMVDLPSGRIWGKLDASSLDAVARRSGAVAGLRGAYRGWCALHPAAQLVERELFAEHGWTWLEAKVDAEVASAGGAHRVRLHAHMRDGRVARRDVEVIEREPLALPLSCGADESLVPQYALAARAAAGVARSGPAG